MSKRLLWLVLNTFLGAAVHSNMQAQPTWVLFLICRLLLLYWDIK
jgi:hypothetical protein